MLEQSRYERIRIELGTGDDDGIAILRLDRPEQRNAVDDVMHSELSTVFADAQDDPRVRVVVLTGSGTAFSVGGDTSPTREYRTKSGRPVMEEARHIVDDVLAMTKPLIAAVNGLAIGLGATLATLADVSYMEERGKLADPHVKAAIPAGNGSAVIWPLLVGINRAKHLLLTGDVLTARDAERLGLVSAVVPDGTALDAAMTLARRFAATPPQALAGTKAALNQILRMVSTAVLPLGLALEETAMQHPDFRAALEALSRPAPPSPPVT